MISAVNKYSIQRWETKAAPWSHENEGKKMFSLFLATLGVQRKIENRCHGYTKAANLQSYHNYNYKIERISWLVLVTINFLVFQRCPHGSIIIKCNLSASIW